MATLRDIKRRIKSVKNTRQITKAMKMVSAAKLRRAEEDMRFFRPYAEKFGELVSTLSTRVIPESHPLLWKGSKGKAELILITSDRGLCGSFNSQLIRTAERFIREQKGMGIEVCLNIVGKRAFEYYKNRPIPAVKTRPFGLGRPTHDAAMEIAAGCVDNYMKDLSQEVYIIYGEFRSIISQKPCTEKILPIIPAGGGGLGEGFIFEPSPEKVLEKLLPNYVAVCVRRALLESSASEHGARMAAMDSASKNAGKMIDYLTLQYNRARQAAITKELMEIVGGAEALK